MADKVTKEEVLYAIIELSKQNIPISLSNIRTKTGGATSTISRFRDEIYHEFFKTAHDAVQMMIKVECLEKRIAELIDLQEKSNQLIESLQQRVEECERNRRDIRAQALSMAEQGITTKDIATTLGVHISIVNSILKKKRS